MTSKNIFIGGVHGAGKTYLSEILASHLNIPNFSASSLIKSENDLQISNGKIVIHPDRNQQLLESAVIRENKLTPKIIIDGHFCLIGENSIFKVELKTFEHLNISQIFIITLNPAALKSQILRRDNQNFENSFLKKLQQTEISHATLVAKQLNIPINIGHRNDLENNLKIIIDHA